MGFDVKKKQVAGLNQKDLISTERDNKRSDQKHFLAITGVNIAEVLHFSQNMFRFFLNFPMAFPS